MNKTEKSIVHTLAEMVDKAIDMSETSNAEFEKMLTRIHALESFMQAVGSAVGITPCYTDPSPYDGNRDLIERIQGLVNLQQQLLKEHDEYQDKNTPDSVNFYYMHDNHTFSKLYGTTVDEVMEACSKIRNKSPWGMMCPPILLRGTKEIRRINHAVHCHGIDKTKEWNNELIAWKKEIEKDYDLMRCIVNNAMPICGDPSEVKKIHKNDKASV